MVRLLTLILASITVALLLVFVLATMPSTGLYAFRQQFGPQAFDPLVGIGLAAVLLLTGFSAQVPRLGASKEVALLAMIVALGSAGRILFVAAPNISPVDWLTLCMGIVFGPLTGFTVGASIMLVSNFWLGHGPWTVYQMVGMGFLGIVGGVMGLFGRRYGRWVLAGVGMVWGFVYGLITSFFWLLIISSVISWTSFGAIWLTGLPFYLLQGTGNAVFLFALGPRTLQMLDRFRGRLTVKIEKAVRVEDEQ